MGAARASEEVRRVAFARGQSMHARVLRKSRAFLLLLLSRPIQQTVSTRAAPPEQDVSDVCHMMLGDMHRVKNPELKEMGSISMLQRVLEDTVDDEIKAIGNKVKASCVPGRVFCSFRLPCCGKASVGQLSANWSPGRVDAASSGAQTMWKAV